MDVASALRAIPQIQKALDKLTVQNIKQKEGKDPFEKITKSAGKASDAVKGFQEQLREAIRKLERDMVKNNMSVEFMNSDSYKEQVKHIQDLTTKVQQFQRLVKDLNPSKAVDYMGSGYGFNAKTRMIDKQIAAEQKRQAEEYKQDLIERRNQVRELAKAEKEREKQARELAKTQAALAKKNTFTSYSAELSKLEHQLTTVYHTMQKMKKTDAGYDEQAKELARLTKEYSKLNRESVNFRKQIGISASRGFYDINHTLDYFRAKVRSRLVYSFATEFEGMMTNLLPNFIDSMKQYQANRVNFAQVMPNDFANNQQAMNDAMREFIQVASDYGASVEDVVEAGRLWGRIYKDVNVIQELVRASTKLSITDDMSLVEVNKGLEATMQQYAIHLNDASEAQAYSSKIIDTWAKLADNAGVTAANLAAASERAGGAAYQAGVGFDSLSAMIATMSQTTGKAGGEVGRSIRSMLVSMNTDRARKQLEKLGIAVYELADDGTKKLRSFEDIIPDLMRVIQNSSEDMSKVILTMSGGKYQYNNVMALLRSYDLYMRNLETARNSQGWADEQVAIQYETISRQIQALNADFQQLIATLDEAGASSSITWIIQGLRTITQLLAEIDPKNITTFSQMIMAFAALKSLKGLVGVIPNVVAGLKEFYYTISAGSNILASARAGVISFGTALKIFSSVSGYALVLGMLAEAVYTLVDAMGSRLAQATSEATTNLQDLNSGFIGQYNRIQDNTKAVNEAVDAMRNYREQLKNTNLSDEERSTIVSKMSAEQSKLKDILGETSLAELEAAGYTEEAVNIAIDAYNRKREENKILLTETLNNEYEESLAVYNNTLYRIKNYDNEIAKIKEVIAARRQALEDNYLVQHMGEDNFLGRLGEFVFGREMADIEEQEKRLLDWENKRKREQDDADALRAEIDRLKYNIEVLQGKRKPKEPVEIGGIESPTVSNEPPSADGGSGKSGTSATDFAEKAKRNQYQRVYNELIYDGKIATTQFNNSLKDLDATEKFEGKTVETATQRVSLYEQRKKDLEAYLDKYEEYQDTLMKDLDAEMSANEELAKAVGWKDDASVNEKLRTMEVNRELFQQIKSYSEIVNQINKVNQQIETTRGQIKDINNQIREATELPMGDKDVFDRAKRDYDVEMRLINAQQNILDPYAEERSLSIRLKTMKKYLNEIASYRDTLQQEYMDAIASGNQAQIDSTKYALAVQQAMYDEFAKEIEKTQREAQEGIRSGLADITTSFIVEGNSWKDIWSNLWQDLAREAIQVLFGVQNVTKSLLGNIVGGFGKGKGSGGGFSGISVGAGTGAFDSAGSFFKVHTGGVISNYPKMHSGGNVEQGRKGVVPKLRNDEVIRTLQVGEEVNSMADRRSNEILGAVAMKALDSEQNRPTQINIMALDSKSFAEYLNDNADIMMAIIGKQQAMGRGTRR